MMLTSPYVGKLSPKQAWAQLCFNQWNENKEKYLILDTETTGLYHPLICEIAVIDLNGNTVFESLVRPKKPIPEEATQIHGITNEMVKDAPIFPEIWTELAPIIEGKTLLIYNSEFDTRAIEMSYKSWIPEDEEFNKFWWRIQTYCVMRAYADLFNGGRWMKLSEASGRDISHRALNDCFATLEVIRKAYDPAFTQRDYDFILFWDEIEQISKRIRYLGYRIRELQEEQSSLLTKQKELLQRLASGDLEEAKKEIAVSIDINDDLPF